MKHCENMRQLVEQRISDLVADGADLSALEFCTPVKITELSTISDSHLLDILIELVGFTG